MNMKCSSKISKVFLRGVLAFLFVLTDVSSAADEICENALCMEPLTGQISWWPGDGNANDIADSNNGTLMGGAIFAPGKVGQAFHLDGIDDFVDAGNAPNLQVSGGDFTINAWVFFTALSHPPGHNTSAGYQGDMSILDKMTTNPLDGGNIDGWRLLKWSDNRFMFCFGWGGDGCNVNESRLFSITHAVTGVWYHVAVVKNSNSFSLYVNGQLEDSRSPVPNFLDTNAANLRIGSNAYEGAHLNGLIDEAEIYNRALSAAEIAAIFTAGNTGKCKETTTISISIKPKHINPTKKGIIQVAILSTSTFRANTIDLTSIRFGKTGTEAAFVHPVLKDIDKDGDIDMLLHFKTQDTAIKCGDVTAWLTGKSSGGQTIKGSDSINTVGCK